MSGFQIAPSKPRRGCRSKRGYPTRGEAELHLERLVREENAQPHTLDVYRCGRCAKFHVGHLGTPGRAT